LKTAPGLESQQTQGIDEAAHEPEDSPHEAAVSTRDASVSDAIWNQLQKDAQKAEEEKRELRRLAEQEEELRQWLKKCADAKRERELAEIERKRQELEEKLRCQALEQEKLAKMGVCPMGYQWIRQSGGYRCAGGSHWVSDGQMRKMCE
jgi:DNA repair exonuclease SbcCD ATPase subunit